MALAKQSRVMFESQPFSSVIANAAIDAVPPNGTTADWEAFLRATSFVSLFLYAWFPLLKRL